MGEFVKLNPEIHPYVLPVVLITSKDENFENVMAVAWFGVLCSEPPHVGVSIRPGRTSNPVLRKSGVFGVCVPTPEIVEEVDFAGTVPGSRVNKFEKLGLDVFYGEKTGVPLIKRCPVNAECILKHVLHLGTHDLFIGEVVGLYVKESLTQNSGLTSKPLNFLLYNHPQLVYYSTGEVVGRRGEGKNVRKEGV